MPPKSDRDRFEWDEADRKNGNVQHLREHGIELEEAEECFFREYLLCRDERKFEDVYILDGTTNRGRRLRLVFQDKADGLARIFTGWDLTLRKRKRKK